MFLCRLYTVPPLSSRSAEHGNVQIKKDYWANDLFATSVPYLMSSPPEKFSLRGKCMRRQDGLCLNTLSLQICICICRVSLVAAAQKQDQTRIFGRMARCKDVSVSPSVRNTKGETRRQNRELASLETTRCNLLLKRFWKQQTLKSLLPTSILCSPTQSFFWGWIWQIFHRSPALSANVFSGEAGISKS